VSDYRLLMVPVDGSDFSEAAIPYAHAIAERSGAQVHYTLVHEPLPSWVPKIENQEPEEQARNSETGYLDGLVERAVSAGLEADGDLISAPTANAFEEHAVAQGFTNQLLNRPVAGALAMHAKQRRADLVVLSTHGRGAIRRLWLGSVAEQLVWQIDQPVLLVKPPAKDGPPPKPQFSNVLVPLDMSEKAEAMLPHAARMARLFGAKVTLVVVLGDPYGYGGMPGPLAAEAVAATVETQISAAEQYLARMAAATANDDLTVETVVINGDSPTSGILRTVEEHGCDLIAMSTHGSGMRELLIGSVTARIIQRTSVPVLVGRP